MKKFILLLFVFCSLFLGGSPIFCQSPFAAVNYPQGYFRDPLNIPIQLAANFGELRPNHFHMGFDIRTNQRENLPVFAAADGYVSRIKIEQYGFGHAIYITHPNGYTTLYAHLNVFYDALENYVKQQQYATQQWAQELSFEPGKFPVKKGQQIALSGNTGGSQGPHLHFEIRDTKTGNNLNDWLFGFGLPDRIPPIISRLYYFDRRYSTYRVRPVPLAAGKVIVLPTNYISFAIAAGDKINAASNSYGIYEASLTVGDTLESAFRLNDISYDETRYANACIDYTTKLSGGPYIQHLSQLPGNISSIYNGSRDATIFIGDTKEHAAVIRVADVAGNVSMLRFKFRYDPALTRFRIPDKNTIDLAPRRENKVTSPGLEADFSPGAFYDTVPLALKAVAANTPRLVSQIHYLHNYTVPVHDSFTVRIKPNVVFDDSLRNRVVMQIVSNKKIEAMKGTWINGWMQAKFRDFGIFRLLIDTVPPTIKLVGWVSGGSIQTRKSITLQVKDDVGELKSFKAFVDGQWIMFSRKDDYFIHTFDGRIGTGQHTLNITAKDVAGNVVEKTFRLMR